MNIAQRCVYLNCKSMQVWGEDFVNDPEFQAGMIEFWCNKTFKSTGPDEQLATLELCSEPGRSCYREFIDLSTGPTPVDGAEPPRPTA